MEQSSSLQAKSHSTKIDTFYGIRTFITVFTKARQFPGSV